MMAEAHEGRAGGVETAAVTVFKNNDSLPGMIRRQLAGLNGTTAALPVSALDGLDGGVDHNLISQLRDRIAAGDTRIVGLGEQLNLNSYRQLKRRGCDEYFVIDNELPLLADYIAGWSMKRMTLNLAVHPVKSGIGGSLIAAGLARFLSEASKVRIVDLNWSHPSVNYWLGIDGTGQLHELVGEGARIDPVLLSQVKMPAGSGVDYYGGYDTTGTGRLDDADAVALESADHVVLVSDLGLPSLRCAGDVAGRCRANGRKVTLVINDPYTEHDIEAQKFASLAGVEDFVTVPRIDKLKKQMLENIYPGDMKSKIRKHIGKIAGKIDDRYKPASRWWGRS